jgi:hypothetical protein
MRITLRNTILVPAVLAIASFAAVSAHAATSLKVPFTFQAAGKNLPAGNYEVSKDASRQVVTLRNVADGRSFTWVAGPGAPAVKSSTATLRFNEIGGSHELRSVQYGSLITSRLDQHTKHNEHVPVETVTGQ